LFERGAEYGNRQIAANPVAGDGKLCHGFALKKILKEYGFVTENRGRRG